MPDSLFTLKDHLVKLGKSYFKLCPVVVSGWQIEDSVQTGSKWAEKSHKT